MHLQKKIAQAWRYLAFGRPKAAYPKVQPAGQIRPAKGSSPAHEVS